jgi:hypothetical protein
MAAKVSRAGVKALGDIIAKLDKWQARNAGHDPAGLSGVAKNRLLALLRAIESGDGQAGAAVYGWGRCEIGPPETGPPRGHPDYLTVEVLRPNAGSNGRDRAAFSVGLSGKWETHHPDAVAMARGFLHDKARWPMLVDWLQDRADAPEWLVRNLAERL